MDSSIRPIETEYNGSLFRSRLEARWAVFLDALDVPYLYEHEGYELPNGSRYLPDFYLPREDFFLEVKPDVYSEHDLRRMSQLVSGTGKRLAVVGTFGWYPDKRPPNSFGHVAWRYSGSLDDGAYPVLGSEGNPLLVRGNARWRNDCYQVMICDECGQIAVVCEGSNMTMPCSDEHWRGVYRNSWINVPPILDRAYRAARSARFEHGIGGEGREEA